MEAEVKPSLYAERDHEAQGEHYLRHIYAMTLEGLHSKSAIAGELAARDIEIEKLKMQLDGVRENFRRDTAYLRSYIR